MHDQETTHLGKVFISIFILIVILSTVLYKILGFEITLIFVLCFSVSIIATAIVGLENIIIRKK